MTSSNSENGADAARLRFPSYHELRWFLNDSEVERRLAMAGPNREPRVQVHPRRGPVDLLVERTLLPPDVDKLVASFRGAAIRGSDADGVIQPTSDATSGRPQTTPLAAPNGELIRLSQVFQSVELGVAPAHARAGECLVIPEDADPSRLVDLCDALAELPDWDARPLRVRDESKQEWTVFRLTPRSEWAAQLSWLRTSPTLLRAGGIRFDLFVPLGKRHPLDGNDRWLLPPLQKNILHAWLPTAPGRAEYKRFAVVGDAVPLARLVHVPDSAPSRRTATGGAKLPKLTLRLARVKSRRRPDDIGEVIYRIDSRGGEVGPAILRLLDHVEAGLEEMTYFSRAVGGSSDGAVEHFVRVARPIDDQAAWLEMHRFECPLALHERRFGLFIAADADFRPDLVGLAAGEPSGDLLRRLAVHLQFDPKGQLALVEPNSDEMLQVTILSGGVPLRDVISVMLPETHRQPIREAVGVARIDLQRDKADHEARWIAEAEEVARESRELTAELFQALDAAATQLGAEATAMQSRVDVARQALGRFLQRLDGAGDDVVQFVNSVEVAMRELADPRRAWHVELDRVQGALSRLREEAETLQRSASERVAALRRQVEEANGVMTRQGSELAAALRRLQTESATLETESATALEAAVAAQTALRQRRERLAVVQGELQRRETQLNADEQEVDAIQRRVDAAQRQLTARQNELTRRRRRLEQQEQQISRDQLAADAEAIRLEEIERVTLPQATEALQRAQQRRDALGALHLDRQLTNVNARLATAQSEVVRLETEAATLERRTAELRVREGELNDRRSTLRDSQRTHEQLETRFTLQQDETSAAVSQRITALQQLEEDVRALRTRLEPSQAPTGNVRWWSFLTRGGRS